MLVYTAKKDLFLEHVRQNQIDKLIYLEMRLKTSVGITKSEIRSWQNSMQFMANVLRDQDIPNKAGVSIEYQIKPTGKRIDFILTGQNKENQETAVIIELKQWSDVQVTDKDATVRTFIGGSNKEQIHPSYQAWTYLQLISDFNETVRAEGIGLQACAYLHNLNDRSSINDPRYERYTNTTPVFISSDVEKLANFLKSFVRYPDKRDLMYRIAHGKISPSRNLADSLVNLLKGNKEFVLIDEQKLAYETALSLLYASQRNGKRSPKQVLIIHGGPGTGKSVVAINLMVEVTNRNLVTQYVSKNAAPRAVYSQKLKDDFKRSSIDNMFSGSGSFTNCQANTFDALFIDEAHRLNEKSGLYSNLGENQIKELINAARLTVFFLDEDQIVTLKDIGTAEAIKRWADYYDAAVTECDLPSQFRCNGSDAYLAWLDSTLQKRATVNTMLSQSEYEFRVFDDPNELRFEIEEKNRINNKARLVAGYCWDWLSKNNTNQFDIFLDGGFSARWNFAKDANLWAIASDSVTEVGCIHTAQGLELDYIGVIIGPDFVIRNGKVICDPSKRSKMDKSIFGHKKLLRENPDAHNKLDQIIKNTYRTLLTRAQKACYVYCVDQETAQYFRSRLNSPHLGSNESTTHLVQSNKVTSTPFTLLDFSKVNPYINAVPLFDLKIAAGGFGLGQVIEDRQWIELPAAYAMREGLFIAQIVGESMNKRIPNGSWCLFRANPSGTRVGKIVIAELLSETDPETQASYTIKRYFSEKTISSEGLENSVIELRPESYEAQFKSIVLREETEAQVRVIGELISVLEWE
jgi:uncharacterized protein